MNANIESLKKEHGDKAPEVLREIASLGGFGSIGGGEGNIPENYPGGLDLAGVLADSNTAVTAKDKDRIAKLAGVTRAQATAIVDDKTGEQSSAHKMKKAEEK